MIIHGTWLLETALAVRRILLHWPTHRGLYCAFHIHGPAALPTQYADNMMAFVVTLLVCPAVVCETQAKDKMKPGPPISNPESSVNAHICSNIIRTCQPDRKQQSNFVVPGQEAHQKYSQNGRDESSDPYPRDTVWNARYNLDACNNGHHKYHTVDAGKECGLQWAETKRRRDDLTLVDEREGDTEGYSN